MHDDAPLQALMLPFETGAVAWPQGDALFLHARAGWPLAARAHTGLQVEQPYKPEADALLAAGYTLADPGDTRLHPLVMLLPPRQRDALRALYARALDRCEEGGVVMASIANASGGKSGEADLRRLAGLDGNLSKHHCRVFWVRKDAARIDHALLAQWRALDAPRDVPATALPQGRFHTRPGVFAWDRIDPASALLAAHLPADLHGRGADLGAGWGYLALQVLARNGAVTAMDLYEADAHAIALARTNLHNADHAAAIDYLWHDVTQGLPQRYDFIVSNPPFHAQDRADRPELGQRFIAVAAAALNPGGRLFLVANRHLPYEAALSAQFSDVRVLAQRDGFKAIAATRTAAR